MNGARAVEPRTHTVYTGRSVYEVLALIAAITLMVAEVFDLFESVGALIRAFGRERPACVPVRFPGHGFHSITTKVRNSIIFLVHCVLGAKRRRISGGVLTAICSNLLCCVN